VSADLPPVWFDQLASERAVVRYRRGQPVRSWERIPGKAAEALDCTIYAFAARQMVNPDWERRRAELAQAPAPRRQAPKLTSDWMKGH
jgi:phage terminase large subunit GpA-like protein